MRVRRLFLIKIKKNDPSVSTIRAIKYHNFSTLMDEIEAFNSEKDCDSLIIDCGLDVNKIFQRFSDQYIWLEAAGGYVINSHGQLLMIYRHKKWDLPKGKIEPNETSEEAAIREVEEETGVKGLQIIRPLQPSFHMYHMNKRHYLKKTFWFELKTENDGLLVPQHEEGIEKAIWKSQHEVKAIYDSVYVSLIDNLELILPKIVQ